MKGFVLFVSGFIVAFAGFIFVEPTAVRHLVARGMPYLGSTLLIIGVVVILLFVLKQRIVKWTARKVEAAAKQYVEKGVALGDSIAHGNTDVVIQSLSDTANYFLTNLYVRFALVIWFGIGGSFLGVLSVYFVYEQNTLMREQTQKVVDQIQLAEGQNELIKAQWLADRQARLLEILYDQNCDDDQQNCQPVANRRARAEAVKALVLNSKSKSGIASGVGAVNLDEINLEGVNLAKADIRFSSFVQANLHKSDFSSANLKYSNFLKADLSKAKLKKADISGAIMRHVQLKTADLGEVVAQRVDFTGANFNGAWLGSADLTGSYQVGRDGKKQAISCSSIQQGKAWQTVKGIEHCL